MGQKNISLLVLGMVLMFMGMSVWAQPVTLGHTKASSWAAGVCCSHSETYEIALQVRVPALMFRVDSVFIGQSLFLGPKREGGSVITTQDSLGSTVRIVCGRSWDSRSAMEMGAKIQTEVATTSPYDGQAKVVYHIGNRSYALMVKEFDEWQITAMP